MRDLSEYCRGREVLRGVGLVRIGIETGGGTCGVPP